MWLFGSKNKELGSISVKYSLRPDGKVDMQFQSKISDWKQKELDRLNPVYQHGMSLCMGHIMQTSQEFAIMLMADVDKANEFETSQKVTHLKPVS